MLYTREGFLRDVHEFQMPGSKISSVYLYSMHKKIPTKAIFKIELCVHNEIAKYVLTFQKNDTDLSIAQILYYI